MHTNFSCCNCQLGLLIQQPYIPCTHTHTHTNIQLFFFFYNYKYIYTLFFFTNKFLSKKKLAVMGQFVIQVYRRKGSDHVHLRYKLVFTRHLVGSSMNRPVGQHLIFQSQWH